MLTILDKKIGKMSKEMENFSTNIETWKRKLEKILQHPKQIIQCLNLIADRYHREKN